MTMTVLERLRGLRGALARLAERPPGLAVPPGWPPWKPLTAEGGALEAAPELRKMLAILPDLRLYVMTGRERSPEVVTFLETVERRHGVELRRPDDWLAGVERIDALYDPAQSGDRRAGRKENPQLARFFDLAHKLQQASASDCHIETEGPRTTIYARVNQRLLRWGDELPREEGLALVAAIYRLASTESHRDFDPSRMQTALIVDPRLPKEWLSVRFSSARTRDDGHTARLRFPRAAGAAELPLQQRGYHARQIEDLRAMVRRPYGGNLIAGPMGSGKTTLLATLLSEEMRRLEALDQLVSLVTAEDPPELPIHRARQIPVGADGYEKTVAHLMRLDANRLVISEIRDRATALQFIEAVTTNHQVWSTTHATSCLGILQRLMLLGVEPWLLATTEHVSGLVAQRLVKTLCPHCRRPVMEGAEYGGAGGLSPVLRDWLQGRSDGTLLERVCTRGRGCGACEHTGYAGMTVIAETLVPDDGLLDLVTCKRFIDAQRHWREMEGYSMADHAADKIGLGLLDPNDLEWILRDQLRQARSLAARGTARPPRPVLEPPPPGPAAPAPAAQAVIAESTPALPAVPPTGPDSAIRDDVVSPATGPLRVRALVGRRPLPDGPNPRRPNGRTMRSTP